MSIYEHEPRSLALKHDPAYRGYEDHTLVTLTGAREPHDHAWIVSMIRRLARSFDDLLERFDRLAVLGDGQERAAALDRHRILLLERRLESVEGALEEMEQGHGG